MNAAHGDGGNDRKLMVSGAQRAGAILISAIVLVTISWHGAIAQKASGIEPGANAGARLNQPKIDDLLTSLAQEWLKERTAATPVAAPTQIKSASALDYLSSGAGTIRNQVVTLARAIPGVPDELRQGVARVVSVDLSQELFNLGIFGVFVLASYAFCRRKTAGVRRRIDALPLQTAGDRLRAMAVRFYASFLPIGGLIVGSALPFFILDWQPITRATIFGLVIAVVLIWAAVAIGNLLLSLDNERFRIIPAAPAAARFFYRRMIGLMSALALIWVVVHESIILGFSVNGQELLGYTIGLGTVGLAWEAIWRRPDGRPSSGTPRRLGRTVCDALVSASIVLLWMLWVAAPGVTNVEPAF